MRRLLLLALFAQCLSLALTASELAEFLKWSKKSGIYDPSKSSLVIKDYRSVPGLEDLRYGLAARKEIKEGEVLAIIPVKFVITASTLLSLPNQPFPKELSSYGEWNHVLALASWLLREKANGKASQWEPYITMLPKTVPNVLSLSPEILKEFDSEYISHEASAQLSFVKWAYEKANSNLIGNASMEDFKWAVSVVQARALYVPSGEKRVEALLAPLVDFFNHNDSKPAQWEFDGKNLVVKAGTRTGTGEQVFASYGNLDNHHLIVTHGFADESNNYDTTQVFEDVDELSKFYMTHLGQRQHSEVDRHWLKTVALKAIESVSDAHFNALRSVAGRKLGFGAYTHGRVDAAALAGLSAMAYFETFHTEPDFRTLSALSTRFSERVVEYGCKEISQLDMHTRVALERGVAAYFFRIGHIANQTQPFEEDQKVLKECSVKKSRPDFCSPLWDKFPLEMKAAFQLRVSRKKIYKDLIDYLWLSCWQAIETVHKSQNKDKHDEL